MVAVPAARAAIETELSYRNETFSSQLTKNTKNTILKLLWLLLMLNSKILGLIWRGTAYFVENDITIFLRGSSVRRANCRTRATYFWRQTKRLNSQNVKIVFLVNLMCVAIINSFSWIVNAFFSEKRCPTLVSFSHEAHWHTNLPRFQGAWPDHVRVESSSCFSLESDWVLFALRSYWVLTHGTWHVPLQSKRIWVGRYNNPIWSLTIGFYYFYYFLTTYFIFTAHLPGYLKLIGWIFEKIIYFIFWYFEILLPGFQNSTKSFLSV